MELFSPRLPSDESIAALLKNKVAADSRESIKRAAQAGLKTVSSPCGRYHIHSAPASWYESKPISLMTDEMLDAVNKAGEESERKRARQCGIIC